MHRLPLLPAERVLSCSCWVLLLHPEAGLAIFTSTHQHVPAERCLDHLMGVCGEGSPEVMRYLEWLLSSLKRKPRGGSSRQERGGGVGGGWGSSDEGDEDDEGGGSGWGDEDAGADDEAVDENAPDAKLQGRLCTMLAQLYIKRIEQTAPPAAAAATSPAAATSTPAAHASKDGEDAAASAATSAALATAAADSDSKEGVAWRGGALGAAAANGASRQPMPSLRDVSISDNFFSSPVDLDASRAASSLDSSGGALSRRSSGLLERQSSATAGTWAGVFRPSGWGADGAVAPDNRERQALELLHLSSWRRQLVVLVTRDFFWCWLVSRVTSVSPRGWVLAWRGVPEGLGVLVHGPGS